MEILVVDAAEKNSVPHPDMLHVEGSAMPTVYREDLDLDDIVEVTYVPNSFDTRYMLTYGTLRLGRGNWDWALREQAVHLKTMQLEGFQHRGGLSAGYTGKTETDFCVVDLFEIKEDQDLAYVNAEIDGLESSPNFPKAQGLPAWGYRPLAVPVTLDDGTVVIAKFYQSDTNGDRCNRTGDLGNEDIVYKR